ncbi:MAG: carbamoyltransferase C-terminal domain-containing protein [Pseudomonadota bacterium]
MKVLGINYGHNATISLMENGKLTFCQSEERFNRLKNSTGFPEMTLAYIYNNIASPEEINAAVLYQNSIYGYLYLKGVGFKPHQVPGYIDAEKIGRPTINQRMLKSAVGWNLRRVKIAMNEKRSGLQAEAARYFSKHLHLPEAKIYRLDHHLAHAYSAVPNIREWGNGLIFTLDGVGDWKSATVNLCRDGKLEVLSTSEHKNSLGYLYAGVTSWMGMKAGEHEFKVMGLAPYAKTEYYRPLLDKLKSIIWIDDQGEWRTSITPLSIQRTLTDIFLYQRFDNVAGAIQAYSENLILQWIEYWVEKTGIHDIALAGGVFMNVKACQKVAESQKVKKLFVVPSAGDESSVIGCAVWGTQKLGPDIEIQPLRDLYLGVEYSESDIEKAILESGAAARYEISIPENINHTAARLLAENQVLSRCSGRMEFGARALGNRSILANPSRFENLQHINDAVKSRDFWMPFTPSILEEDMPRYVVNPKQIFAPYMCITFQGAREAQRDLVAAIHPKDHTVRPQSVIKDWNPDYYELISAFKDLTGIGGVLNTSFNLHGEPNVCSPQDAIRTVDNSGLSYLILGRYLLSKKKGQGI